MINIKLIGVGGFARSGKDLFVKIASKILKEQGYSSKKLAFADALKNDLDSWLLEKYGISAWTVNDDEKKLIRPLMVAHGCCKRTQTNGKYWVEKIDLQIINLINQCDDKTVFFVSDVRFENEAEWIHSWGGWVVHLKKYDCIKDFMSFPEYVYSPAPNEEEEKNDPLLQKKCDFFLELENVSSNKKLTDNELLDNVYLNNEIGKCLTKCPFLTIPTQ